MGAPTRGGDGSICTRDEGRSSVKKNKKKEAQLEPDHLVALVI